MHRITKHTLHLSGVFLVLLFVWLQVQALKLAPQVLADSFLVLYLPFNETTGLTANDASGFKNNGLLQNNPTWTTGKFGNGLAFNGSGGGNSTGQHVQVLASPSINNLNKFTWMAWAKPMGEPGNWQGALMTKSDSMDQKSLRFWGDGNSSILHTVFGIVSASYESTAQTASQRNGYTMGTWDHWAVTYDNSGDRTVHLFKNGQEVPASIASALVGALSSDAEIDLRISDFYYPFNGVIDEVRVYNRVLSASEIQSIMNSPETPAPTPTPTPTPTPAPTVTLSVSPSTITAGQSATLTWSSTNATACSGTGLSSSATAGSVVVAPSVNTTYTVSCTGSGGSASRSVTLTVTAPSPTPTPTPTPAPTASLSVSPSTITAGQSATLAWSSTNATACSGSGFSTSNATAGSVVVTPSATTNYSVACTGAGGTSTNNTTLTVNAPAPTPTPTPGPTVSGGGPNPPANFVIAGRTFDPNEALVIPPAGTGGKTYYVDASIGNDAANGTSLTTPFKTIQRGLNALSAGGDRVLIRKGLYRERVSVLDKDAPNGNPFIVSAYGDGEVILDGSKAVSGWTLSSGNIYQVRPGFVASAVVIDNQPYYKETSLAALQGNPTVAGVPAEQRFFYSSTGDLYVRTSGGNPGTRDTGVLIDDKDQDVFYLWNSNNYVIYGLTVRFGGGRGINVYGSTNTRIERNRVAFNNWTGISTISLDGTHSGANHKVIKNYVYFNFMSNWPRGNNGWVWGGWGAGIGIQGTPAALVEGNISQRNGGEGILTYLGGGGTVFRNNISVDNWSVNLYYDNSTDGIIEGNVAMCHTPSVVDMYNNGEVGTSEAFSTGIRRLRPIAIMTADENYGTIPPATLNNVIIRNNLMINCQKGIEHYGQAPGSGLKNVKVLNNTIVMPSTVHALEQDVIGISIPYNGGRNTGSVYENNIILSGGYFAKDTGFLMRSVEENTMSGNFTGVTIDHNLFYQPNTAAKIFRWGGGWGTDLDYSQWAALSGGAHGAGDVLANPNLLNPSSDNPFEKKLQSGSPAMNAGVNDGVAADFLGVLRPQGSAYDMGAFEQ